MHPMLNIAIQAVRQASKIIVRFEDQIDTLTVSEKTENDFATQVDQLAENEIIAHIRRAYPAHAFLAEESGKQGDATNDYCWIIDPLDGTTNFVHRFPHYCISIALLYKNQLEVGVVYDPIRQDLFTAAKGKGAHLNNRRIRVSQTKKLEHALIGTGFPFRHKSKSKTYFETLHTVFSKVSDIRRAGAAALDLAYVAAGMLDGFWEADLKPWDIAAGILLIKEAGGIVSDFSNEGRFLDSGNVIAGNPRIHKELVPLIHSEN